MIRQSEYKDKPGSFHPALEAGLVLRGPPSEEPAHVKGETCFLGSSGRALLHTLLDAEDEVQEPVELDGPAFVPADLDLVQEVSLGLVLGAAHGQRLPDVLDVLLAGELGHAGHQHHGEQDDQQVGVVAQGQVGLHTHLLQRGGTNRQ